MIKLSDEEKETLSYDDVAYLILKDINKKIKITDLFKKVLTVLGEDEDSLEDKIGDFFELLITDKRFIMLDNGYCDLKINHSTKIIIDEDDEDLDISLDDENLEDIDNTSGEDNYDEDANPDDTADDDLQDLVIIDDTEELDSEMN